MISLQRVTKKYHGTPVLADLSLEVAEGETVALLGLSGSGKTTALKLVCGLAFPDQGEVSVQGLRVSVAHLPEVRARIGYVAQNGGLFPHLTAAENIALAGQPAGWDAARVRARTEELATLTQIPRELLDRYPGQLSGGQRQRIGIMRALLRDPPVLLLDEPMGALDPITRSELQDELKQLFARLQKTVLLVTHDLFEAGHLARRILLLNHGRIAQTGSMAELMQSPADPFVRQFVNSQRRMPVEGTRV